MDLQATTPTSTLFNTREIHVELSSKCTLKCPRCPRTELKPEFLNKELSLADFAQAFDQVISTVEKFVFCGDIGDPIYNRDLLDILHYIKRNSNASVTIVTNGSYKDPVWWRELGSILRESDQVTFSVDGWDQASNEQYRVNSNWDSTIAGMRALRESSNCKMNWSAIYFAFNEHKMTAMSELAKSLGFNTFEFVRSSKFGQQYAIDGIDLLEPTTKYRALGSQYQKQKIYFKPPKINVVMRQSQAHEWARCLKWEKELFINVEGLVFPCPWFNSGYQHNDFVQKYKDRMSIKTRSLTDVLQDPMWDEFITRIETMPLQVCRIKCKDCRE